MTDLWEKDADPVPLGKHYINAVHLLTGLKVFEKSECATVIALHAQEIERLRRALQTLDDMIFNDPQIIERAGEMRFFITNILAE